MSRSKWKIEPIQEPRFEKKILVPTRHSIVSSYNLGKIAKIHNGKKNIFIKVFPDQLGAKFGEFVTTRKLCVHKTKKLHK
mgnify:CR=1 FL=1|jgi:ribosomal protein S19